MTRRQSWSSVRGASWDVVVDLCKRLTAYKVWVEVERSVENKRQLLISHGLLLGYVTLTDDV